MSRPPLDLSNYKTVCFAWGNGNVSEQCFYVGRDPSREEEFHIVMFLGNPILAEREQIVLGMIARCKEEIARAKSEINRDEWAMLGARDWTQELEEWKKLL